MSKLEVDAIEPQSGTTLTIGASGDVVNIASGATITDFTSTGIDDNATSTAIEINSFEQVILYGGQVQANTNTSSLIYSGGNNSNAGANLTLFGGSHASTPNVARFRSSATEVMRIDGDGKVKIATTSTVSTTASELFAVDASTDKGHAGVFAANQSGGFSCIYLKSGSSVGNLALLYRNSTKVGSITTNGTSTAYNTTSDYRLKENVSYDFDATTRLKQLKPARFNFIEDEDITVDGFLAHEVQSVIPEAISGEKDATETKEKVVVNVDGNVIAENIKQADWETGKIADEDGNIKYPTDSTWEATKVVPDYQGIDQAKLVPLLVKTIQELEARITTLENA